MTARTVSTRGTADMTLSVQAASRPDDQRFLSLDDLHQFTRLQAQFSTERVVDFRDVDFDLDGDDNAQPVLITDHGHMGFTNHTWGQVCQRVGAPAGFLGKLSPGLAAEALRESLARADKEAVKLYWSDFAGDLTLRAVTGTSYGRVYDHEVVAQVKRLVRGSGVEWKVPGVLDWSTGKYDPDVPVTKQTTTLYASDRDVFGFLCADKDPIEVGTLPNGDPDLMFRGFYFWNSETGSRTLGFTTMYLRAVCCNRILWGVENVRRTVIKHSSRAPQRFQYEALPVIDNFAHGEPLKLVNGVRAAKAAVVVKEKKAEDRREAQVAYLKSIGFSGKQAEAIIAQQIKEEQGGDGPGPLSAWDFAQGVTAYARGVTHADERFDVEKKAQVILDKVS